MTDPVPVRVRAAGVPRPAWPPYVMTMPDVPEPEWYEGMLWQWRWIAEEGGPWAGFVRYRRANQLAYEHWVAGEHLQRLDGDPGH